MKYMGSKARYAKQILPLILANRRPDQWYVEPFVGGANVIQHVRGPRLGADINPYLIALLCAVRDGWTPPANVSEEEYAQARSLQGDPKLIGFIGIGCSYSGKWFGGYARGDTADGRPRNYARESRDNIVKQAPGLWGVDLVCADYRQLAVPDRSVIYCDPPYADTTKYRDSFDHAEFWRWCNFQVESGHPVFVSEYAAPEPWRSIWEKETTSSLTKDTGSKRAVERLWTR